MDTKEPGQGLSRRQVLSTAGLAAVAIPLAARPAAALVRQADVAGAPGPEQVHVQFGASGSMSLRGNACVVLRQLLEAVINILRHEASLLDPAFLPAGGSHPNETLLLL